MNNLRRKALEISSKFGLITSQRTLMIAISEEREVHESILKLLLSRVNASTSLLRWAKMEQNESLKGSLCQLYDISLMFSSVQRDFAEQSNYMTTALKDIFTCEIKLEGLQKRLREATEKKERLQKSEAEGVKRRTNITDELSKVKDEEESLKVELDMKSNKAEVFKCRSLKTSFKAVCDAHLNYAKKMKQIFTAAQQIVDGIEEIPDPSPSKSGAKTQVRKSNNNEENCLLVQLAKDLDISKPMSSNQPAISSKFHVDLPKNSQEGGKEELKKLISNPILLSPPSRPMQSIQRDSTVEPNVTEPTIPIFLNNAVTNKFYSRNSEYDYIKPWDNFEADQDEAMKAMSNEFQEVVEKDRSVSEPIAVEVFYDDPADIIGDRNDIYGPRKIVSMNVKDPKIKIPSTPSTVVEEQIYMDPREDIAGSAGQNIYRNTVELNDLETVEYMDNNLIREPIKSRKENFENIILTNNSPSPTRSKPKFGRLSSQSVRLPGDQRKKIPPQPKPRPGTVVYENTTLCRSGSPDDACPPTRCYSSVQELAAQISGKIQPASLVPSFTQAKMKEKEEDVQQYANL